jgi:hypothetical protein
MRPCWRAAAGGWRTSGEQLAAAGRDSRTAGTAGRRAQRRAREPAGILCTPSRAQRVSDCWRDAMPGIQTISCDALASVGQPTGASTERTPGNHARCTLTAPSRHHQRPKYHAPAPPAPVTGCSRTPPRRETSQNWWVRSLAATWAPPPLHRRRIRGTAVNNTALSWSPGFRPRQRYRLCFARACVAARPPGLSWPVCPREL